MQICFISNYINHHQIPFCKEMLLWCRNSGDEFIFIQTEEIAQWRLEMGWKDEKPEYVIRYFEEPERAQKLIDECEVLIFGGVEESYIQNRLSANRLIIRYSERLYKEGRWKAVSPRGLKEKYHDHTAHNKDRVYLLCAGAYTAGDFDIFGAYPGKKFNWGYFPEIVEYDIDEVMRNKPEKLTILWAGRFIREKHPEMTVEAAQILTEAGIDFELNIIGTGECEEMLVNLIRSRGFEEKIHMLGPLPQEKVREYMLASNIYLFTTDRYEGWGAVANEAMNSGCCVLASHIIGAAPMLIKDGVNGLIYKYGSRKIFKKKLLMAARDAELVQRCGRNGYRTVAECWNPAFAVKRLMELLQYIENPEHELEQNPKVYSPSGEFPCSFAKSRIETGLYRRLTGGK